MIPLTKRQIYFFGSTGAAGVLLLLVYFLFYSPLLSELGATRQRYLALEGEVALAHKTLGGMGDNSLRKEPVTEQEISLAIDEVTRAGKRKGVNFVSLTPRYTEEIKDLRFKILPIEMETDASFQALGEFLGSLDELEKSFVTLEQFEITPDAKNPSRLRARVIIHMYFLR